MLIRRVLGCGMGPGAACARAAGRRANLRRIAPSLLPLLTALAAGPTLAAAPVLPVGGSVVAGSATIGTPSSTGLSISQTSSRAIIDWSGFSIGSGGTVRFDNGAGATLNRVTGGSVSSIDGLLSASGSVYLINPNGVIVGKDGVVNVGGTFVASSLDTSNSGFMAGGDLTFSGASTASVINLGHVGSLGGDVALIGATVQNSGSITAPDGDVGLIAGQSVLMRDGSLNDGRFTVLVGGSATSATNSGTITAAEAELRAEGGNVYALAGNTTGVIRATGIATGGGKVFLVAEGGTTTAQGEIDATNADGSGGQVETSGAAVNFDGLTVKAGNWLVDPSDLTVNSAAAATISSNLATTDVTLQTGLSGTSGPGVSDGLGSLGQGGITVASAIGWSSAHTLTLDAYNSIAVLAPITVSGAGKVVLITNGGGVGGRLLFGYGGLAGFAGGLTFTGTPGAGQSLTINAQSYQLLYSIADVAGVSGGLTGDYALAKSIDASGTTYSDAVIPGTFSGTFEGLGHTISNLSVNAPGANSVGLFADISPQVSGSPLTGIVQNLGLVGGSVVGGSGAVGALAGANSGTISNTYASTQVTGGGNAVVGGLVGANSGSLLNVDAMGAVTGGLSEGGLTGSSSGTIDNAFASGAVTLSQNAGFAGGLVGVVSAGTITRSFATGAVSATGDTLANDGLSRIGGLVGQNGGSLSNTGASGAVIGGYQTAMGGLIGQNNGTVSTSYSTGFVFDAQHSLTIGGLIGFDFTGSSVTNGYYDADTSGQLLGAQTDGSVGLHTYALQGLQSGQLPAGFSFSVWQNPGSYPYLSSLYPLGQQIFMGTAYASSGVTAPGAQVGLYVGASLVGGAPLISGANGYLYLALPAGTYPSTSGLIMGETISLGGGPVSGVTYSDGPNFLNYPSISITSGVISVNTQDVTLSAAMSHLPAPFGASDYNGFIGGLSGADLDITANNTFTIDQSPAMAGSFSVTARTGLYVDAPIAWSNANTLTLISYEGTFLQAPITVSGPGHVVLPTGVSFELNDNGFANTITFTGTPGGGQSLTIGSHAYTLLYKLSDGANTAPDNGTDDVAGIDAAGDSGYYALATNLDGTGVMFTSALAGAGSNTFTGAFEGLGHTITNLTINQASASAATGLFGTNSGGIGDVGLVGGSVTGQANTGALVGTNSGYVGTDFASTAVNTPASTSIVGPVAGGLVGVNLSPGRITSSFATGDVSGSMAGGLVGENASVAFQNPGSISGSYATGSVTGVYYVGGLVGLNQALVSYSYATGSVSGSALVGGLVGRNSASITNSYATGDVTGLGANSGYIGGLVGDNFGGSSILYSFATGAVAGGQLVGGLVGKNDAGNTFLPAPIIVFSYASGSVSGQLKVGGLAGENDSSITYSRATGNVVGSEQYIGGLVGKNLGAISQTFASGSVTGAAGLGSSPIDLGGLVGANYSNISLSYATGAVSGIEDVGGLVGSNNQTSTGGVVTGGTITTSYATGPITGVTATGGLVGINIGGAITSSYWDTTTSGQSTSAGGTGLTTAQFGVASNFSGFTFGYTNSGPGWVIVDVNGTLDNAGGAAGATRPMLISEYSRTITDAHQVQLTALDPTTTYSLAGDIDMSGTSNPSDVWIGGGFSPIGAAAPFTGSLDGAGHTISNLVINRPTTNNVGLFAVIGATGVVKNLILSGGSVTGANDVGDLAGLSYGAITGVSASGTVSGVSAVGGLVGYNDGSVKTSSAGTGAVTGTSMVGGLIGWNDRAGVVTGASDAGATVTAGSDGGGLVGYNLGHISASAAGDDVMGTGSAYALGTGVGLNGAIGIISGLTASGTVSIGGNLTSPLIGVDLSASLGAMPPDPWPQTPPPAGSSASTTPPPLTPTPVGVPLPPDKPLQPAAIAAAAPTPAAPAVQLAKNLTPRRLTLALTSRMFQPPVKWRPGSSKAAPQVSQRIRSSARPL